MLTQLNRSILNEFLPVELIEYFNTKGLIPITLENFGKVNSIILTFTKSLKKSISQNKEGTGFKSAFGFLISDVPCDHTFINMADESTMLRFDENEQLVQYTIGSFTYDVSWEIEDGVWDKTTTSQNNIQSIQKLDMDYRLLVDMQVEVCRKYLYRADQNNRLHSLHTHEVTTDWEEGELLNRIRYSAFNTAGSLYYTNLGPEPELNHSPWSLLWE